MSRYVPVDMCRSCDEDEDMTEYCEVCGQLYAIDGTDGHEHDVDETIALQGEARARSCGYSEVR